MCLCMDIRKYMCNQKKKKNEFDGVKDIVHKIFIKKVIFLFFNGVFYRVNLIL